MNNSYWIETSVDRNYESLLSSVDCDCAVIGGGIAGLTTAYLLAKSNQRVELVDANRIGHGCTGRNTGKVTPQHSVIYSKIKKKYGIEGAKKYYQGNKEAVDFIEKIVRENGFSCEFKRTTSYLYATTDKGMRELQDEYDVCEEIGIDCEFFNELPIPIDIKGAIAFNNVAEFNPKMYCDCLGELITKEGGRIYENSPIIEVERGAKCTIKTRQGKNIQCSNLILASHYPFYDGASFYFSRLKPTRTYLVAGVVKEGFVEGMYINVEDPTRSIHYINGIGEHLLLIAGEKHIVGQGKDVDYYEILKEFGRKEFGVKEYKYQWSAEDYTTPDELPYIGRLNENNSNIFLATGFNKWGMTNGTLAGRIISDLIINGESEYQETFEPSRLKGILTTEFFKFNAEVAYHYIKGKLTMGEVNAEIENGESKVIFYDGHRYGAYRDEKGKLYIVDITCTHLGCELNWNEVEKSWDCPCHGSRFDYKGNILEGPATEPLKQWKDHEGNKVNPQLN